MVSSTQREHAKHQRDDAGAWRSAIRDELKRDDNSPSSHKDIEEEVFDDMVWHHLKDDPKKMDDDVIEQEHLYKASLIPVFEGCTFSILHASLELLNLQIVYGWSNASLNASLK